jgi:nucleotide sugar dehydrogenase
MKSQTVGVIGLGFVGTAVLKGFESIKKVVTYDIQKPCTETSIADVVRQAEVIFICVPTPMNTDGTCNTSIVESVLHEVSRVDVNHRPVCVIKSTITPGTTNRLADTYPNITVAFNPEFLTEKNYINDFLTQVNIIVGYSNNISEVKLVCELYWERFPNANVSIISAKESEMIKYVANTFLATKVAYLNEIWQICERTGINYNHISNILGQDDRLGSTHWNVPGHDGHFGFGGTCFPKDINALIKYANQNGQDTPLLNAVWQKNLEVRPERDWELDKGRAVI